MNETEERINRIRQKNLGLLKGEPKPSAYQLYLIMLESAKLGMMDIVEQAKQALKEVNSEEWSRLEAEIKKTKTNDIVKAIQKRSLEFPAQPTLTSFIGHNDPTVKLTNEKRLQESLLPTLERWKVLSGIK